jgi:hypothetical protein
MINQTRFKGLLILLALTFIEAILSMFVPAFPFIAACGFEWGGYGTFCGLETAKRSADKICNGDTNGTKQTN